MAPGGTSAGDAQRAERQATTKPCRCRPAEEEAEDAKISERKDAHDRVLVESCRCRRRGWVPPRRAPPGSHVYRLNGWCNIGGAERGRAPLRRVLSRRVAGRYGWVKDWVAAVFPGKTQLRDFFGTQIVARWAPGGACGERGARVSGECWGTTCGQSPEPRRNALPGLPRPPHFRDRHLRCHGHDRCERTSIPHAPFDFGGLQRYERSCRPCRGFDIL